MKCTIMVFAPAPPVRTYHALQTGSAELCVISLEKELSNMEVEYTLHCSCLKHLGLALNEKISKLTKNPGH